MTMYFIHFSFIIVMLLLNDWASLIHEIRFFFKVSVEFLEFYTFMFLVLLAITQF